jgi:hypothetical protein
VFGWALALPPQVLKDKHAQDIAQHRIASDSTA